MLVSFGRMSLAPEDTRILLVEDNALERTLVIAQLQSRGYEPRAVVDGEEAWELLSSHPDGFDVVLLDRSLPRLNGLQLLERMKQHQRLRLVPVILQTAMAGREHILEGLRAGAYYYLAKPYDPDLMAAVVSTAANDYLEYREVQEKLRKGLQSLAILQSASFSLATVEQARDLAALLARTCPDPAAAVVGLTELLLNAVEHGNLGITYDEKSALATREEWHAEVERRLSLPENAGKRVTVSFERASDELRFSIRDEGAGFDWRRYLEIDPTRAFDTHGRGIVMAKAFSFSSLRYNECGNEVIATVSLGEEEMGDAVAASP